MTTLSTRRFTPTAADVGGFEYQGVPVFQIPGNVLVALTGDRGQAVAAMTAYLRLELVDDRPVTRNNPGLRYGIGVFEREPADSERPWTLRLVPKADTTTVPLHHLPI